MKTRSIPSSWTNFNDLRLDSKPYLSGAFEARITLNRIPADKSPLHSLTKDGIAGIFNGPRFARSYVQDPTYGVPFLGSTDILFADLSTLPFLSKRQVKRMPGLTLDYGWTLITCSGTIGKMVFSRRDMKGMAGSQHFMRVVPDESKVLPGYLYAYLSSKFGIPQVISGTYGAIIQHIEPSHIADLPVPRLGAVERTIHNLVVESSELHVQANLGFKKANRLINSHFNFPDKIALSHRVYSTTKTLSSKCTRRLDATFHDKLAQESDELLSKIERVDPLGVLVPDIREPGRLKQVFATSVEYGVPFLTSGEIFRLNLEPARFLSKKMFPSDNSWVLREGDILIARSGQVGGIIGHGVWADKRLERMCVSSHVLKLRADNQKIRSGYLFGYLCLTDVGYRQIVRTAAGSSIPDLQNDSLYDLMIPRADEDVEKTVDELVWQAGRYRAEAQAKETEARTIVEKAIEGKI